MSAEVHLPEALKSIADKSFMVVIQDFQDPYTLNVKALMKCCVEEITPDGRLIPFCAYNSVGYREEIREQLSGAFVPTIVPNATELQPVLLTVGVEDVRQRRRWQQRFGPVSARSGRRHQHRQDPPLTVPFRPAGGPSPASSPTRGSRRRPLR